MYQNPYLYQNPYPYQYSHFYMDNMYNSRELTSKVGSFFTILNNVPISGGAIPSGTRVFIHRVRLDAGGNEIVTIVFPQVVGGNCIVRATEVLGSVLEAPAQVEQLHF
ncbi:hypothetical protein [Bacillus cereus group sp. BfR-BA-01310]|uniref:hypothetical protein n=1 Tax=Bacillus cereus group sp. BfR-BA-01310 TaxID=2920287 RepID=UPI001F560247|nr:hypothetical protein [Bacillus cereus group sp. BfR-BA-01310]